MAAFCPPTDPERRCLCVACGWRCRARDADPSPRPGPLRCPVCRGPLAGDAAFARRETRAGGSIFLALSACAAALAAVGVSGHEWGYPAALGAGTAAAVTCRRWLRARRRQGGGLGGRA